ncbi:hypothetical protein ABKN59_003213 [Abortiporus biennis]
MSQNESSHNQESRRDNQSIDTIVNASSSELPDRLELQADLNRLPGPSSIFEVKAGKEKPTNFRRTVGGIGLFTAYSAGQDYLYTQLDNLLAARKHPGSDEEAISFGTILRFGSDYKVFYNKLNEGLEPDVMGQVRSLVEMTDEENKKLFWKHKTLPYLLNWTTYLWSNYPPRAVHIVFAMAYFKKIEDPDHQQKLSDALMSASYFAFATKFTNEMNKVYIFDITTIGSIICQAFIRNKVLLRFTAIGALLSLGTAAIYTIPRTYQLIHGFDLVKKQEEDSGLDTLFR